jgi:tetratricopeptide (TPR) repeat protein
MRGAALAACAVLCACATPLEEGERLYREGDRLGALETWRSVPEDAPGFARARERIAAVEPDFERLVAHHLERALAHEREERLAEAILDYRLALALHPDDAATLERVQRLARTLAGRKGELLASYRAAFDAGDLAAARRDLAELRRLDPFDPAVETEWRLLAEALSSTVEGRMEAGRRAFAAGRHDAAASSFRAALALDPENEAARGYLSYIAAMRREGRSGSPPAALAESGAGDVKLRAQAFHQSALAAERRGEPYAAIRYELRALESNPEHASARRHLEALRRRLAGEVEALVEAGRIAFRAEDLQTALELWRQALLVDPGNERVLAYIGRAEQQLQNLERLRAERNEG